jgi:class 3 adenylate cyclase
MSDDWFWFQRDGDAGRPETVQSRYLDELFLGKAGVRIGAAWCISCRDRRLIYFWGDRTAFNESTNVSGQMGYCIKKFSPFFEMLHNSSVLYTDGIFETEWADPIKYVESKAGDSGFSFEIYAGRRFIYLYQIKGEHKNPQTDHLNLRTHLLACSEQGYEFAVQARHFFDRIPKSVLNIDQGPDKLISQYFGPACYEVGVPSQFFAWPWQKGREKRDDVMQPLEIATISLQMDIRNSSSAMLLTREAPKFSEFIDKVVENARDVITSNGGYFDKETGDGVVGHFEGPQSWHENAEALKQALSAARGISVLTTRLCEQYQENLNIRLQGLGCAVGLFAGKAVWLYSWRGVRAIGGSIVNAKRICDNAGPGEVGYCNTISNLIRSAGVSTELFPLSGTSRPIELSEVRDAAIPEATFVRIN